jgi:radical SAM protein with 4Fe4S-binding SPASM domain
MRRTAVAPEDGVNLDFPRKIQIQTVNRCNYACQMCPYPEVADGVRTRHMEDSLLLRLLDEVRGEGRRVRLCLMLQNEPLLDRRFVDFLRLAHDADDAVETISAVSNGSALTPELLDELVAFERFRFTVSINANDREAYRRIHQRDLWPRIHELFSGWGGDRERVRLSFVVDPDAVGEARRFQGYWHARGYPTRLVAMNSRISAVDRVPVLHEVDEDFEHCSYPVETLTVLADGRVILCCNDWDHSLTFGNLRDSSIREVWNQPELAAYRRASLEGSLRSFEICRNCDYPTRSAERLGLEAWISGAPEASAADDGTVHHLSELRPDGGGAGWPLAVVGVRDEAGQVLALAQPPGEGLPETGRVHLPIGFSEQFTFGDLLPVWCPARVEVEAEPVGDLLALRLVLDRAAPEFRFFRWYCADWRRPIINAGRHEQEDSWRRRKRTSPT